MHKVAIERDLTAKTDSYRPKMRKRETTKSKSPNYMHKSCVYRGVGGPKETECGNNFFLPIGA